MKLTQRIFNCKTVKSKYHCNRMRYKLPRQFKVPPCKSQYSCNQNPPEPRPRRSWWCWWSGGCCRLFCFRSSSFCCWSSSWESIFKSIPPGRTGSCYWMRRRRNMSRPRPCKAWSSPSTSSCRLSITCKDRNDPSKCKTRHNDNWSPSLIVLKPQKTQNNCSYYYKQDLYFFIHFFFLMMTTALLIYLFINKCQYNYIIVSKYSAANCSNILTI